MLIHLIEGDARPLGTLAGVRNRNSFGAPRFVTVGKSQLTFVSNSNSFGVPKLSAKLALSGFANPSTIGSTQIRGYLGTLCVVNVNAFGSHSIANKGVLTPAGVVNATVFGSPTVRDLLRLTAEQNQNSFGTPGIIIAGQLLQSSVGNSNSFGSVGIKDQVHDSFIANVNTFGRPDIALGTSHLRATAVINNNVIVNGRFRAKPALTGFSNAQSFGAPSIRSVAGPYLLEDAFSPPPAWASGTWSDYSSAAVPSDITIGGVKGVRIAPLGTAFDTLNGLVGPLPVGAWTVTARLRRHMPLGGALSAASISYPQQQAAGLVLWESATNKFQLFGWTRSGIGDLRATVSATFGPPTGWSIVSSLSTPAPATDNWVGASGAGYDDWEMWFRIVRTSGGQYQYWISQDGDFWSMIKSYSLTSPGFSVAADHIGFAVDPCYGAGSVTLDCFSWSGPPVPAAPSIVQSIAFSAADAAFTFPGAVTPGNFIVVFAVGSFHTGNIAGTGFTEYKHIFGGITHDDFLLWYRKALAGDGTVFTASSNGSTFKGVAVEVTNLPSTWAAAFQQEEHIDTGDQTSTLAGLTSSADNTLVIGFGENNGLSGTDSLSAGWTLDANLGHGAILGHTVKGNGSASPTLQVNTTGTFNISWLAQLFLNHA